LVTTQRKLSAAITLAILISLSYSLTQCNLEAPPAERVDAACVSIVVPRDMREPVVDMSQAPDLQVSPDLAFKRTTFEWWEFERWWDLIAHGGGYCAPDDGNWQGVMDAFCRGQGWRWAVLNGERPVGDCTTWDGHVAPVYNTIQCSN
jgi:hypothetical protein